MITSMARIKIVCMKRLTADLISFVQEQGVVHIEDVPAVLADEPGYLNPLCQNTAEKKEQDRLERLQSNLKELASVLTVTPRPVAIAGAAAALRGTPNDNWEKIVRKWDRTLRPLSRRCLNLEDNIGVIRQYMNVLAALASQIDTERFQLGAGARFLVIPSGRLSQSQHIADVLEEKLGPEVRFLFEKMGRHATAGLVLYPEAMDQAVSEALADAGIGIMDSPEAPVRGMSISEAIKTLQRMIKEQQHIITVVAYITSEFLNSSET